VGVCGKSSETAAIQDTLMSLVRNMGQWAVAADKAGVDAADPAMKAAHLWTLQATFSTLTNVNFSDERIGEYIVSLWFHVLFTPLPGFFSPFPHGTISLSVIHHDFLKLIQQ